MRSLVDWQSLIRNVMVVLMVIVSIAILGIAVLIHAILLAPLTGWESESQ